MPSNSVNLENTAYFGFKSKTGSTHLARTIMLEDLETLLAYINAPEAEKATYIRAIERMWHSPHGINCSKGTGSMIII